MNKINTYYYKINRRNCYIKLIITLIVFVQITAAYDVKADSRDFEIQQYKQTLSTLPTYCQDKLVETQYRNKFTFNGKENWPPIYNKSRMKSINQVGVQNWAYVHHYCFGLRAYNEYSTLSYDQKKIKKNHILRRALEEFEFMRVARISNFPFMYNLYTYQALIYTDLGDHMKASWALKQSQKYRNNRK